MSSILIIDDSSSARAETRRAVAESGLFHCILEASDGVAGLQLLLTEAVDVVLCDLEMPGLDGEKLLRARSFRPGGDQIPFIFLTSTRDPNRCARLLRAGANDLITKPFHAVDLIARLEIHQRVMRLQAELREKNAMLEHLSSTDPVTGLRTRRFVDELLSIEVLRASRFRTPLTVLMVDLDHFKRVNDEHGHPAGDVVLAGVGEIVRTTLRATDVAGRYGGEEFLILLPQTKVDGGTRLARRLRQSIEDHEFESPAGRAIRITTSLGVAAFCDAMSSPEDLIEAVDGALYGAKEAGRNTIVVARSLAGLDRP